MPHRWLRRAATLISRRTLDAIVRQHTREKEALLAVIREQNDRLMLLMGVPYAPSPLVMHEVAGEPEDEDDLPIEVGQLPDGLGDSW